MPTGNPDPSSKNLAEDVRRQVTRLGLWRYERESALRALKAMGPGVIEYLLPRLKGAAARHARLNWTRVLLFFGFPVMFILEGGWENAVAFAAAYLLLQAAHLFNLHLCYRDECVVLALAHFDNVHAIGPFMDAMGFQETGIWDKRFEAILIGLLRRVQSCDADVLSKKHREQLNAALRSYGCADSADPELILAILAAYEQVGGRESLPFVDRLTGMKASLEEYGRVKAAAQHCLPILRSRVEKQRQPAILLRPADAPPAKDTLLRPATGAVVTDPQVLVRSAGAEED